MRRLLENKLWDWVDKQMDLPLDESDKIIFLICGGMLCLLGLGYSLPI